MAIRVRQVVLPIMLAMSNFRRPSPSTLMTQTVPPIGPTSWYTAARSLDVDSLRARFVSKMVVAGSNC